MLMTRWTPFLTPEFAQLRDQMDRLFNQLIGQRTTWPALAYSYPPVNVWEDENNVYAEAELPGMDLNSVEIYVTDGNQLTIRGQRPTFEEKGIWHRQERGVGQFCRVLTLPVDVDPDHVDARLENGVLHLTLPKSETAKPRRITVKAE